ncbi:hypothetical protein QBC42DRAFT_85502 [Cladorrhinum samala]|uniref:Uncharacterized protein n=1 Tax=Cladorrhinum samala TaxID=585594 RepID=A0AAV9HMP6_9PEZI|nr:hypothetical protein QBC42DRAFT_85502 [Cladorrhinum samala]
MPAIDYSYSQLAKRSNWPAKNAGVMVVFCIVGVVGIGLIFLFVMKKMAARKERRAQVI